MSATGTGIESEGGSGGGREVLTEKGGRSDETVVRCIMRVWERIGKER
jgi:hypothetical protein